MERRKSMVRFVPKENREKGDKMFSLRAGAKKNTSDSLRKTANIRSISKTMRTLSNRWSRFLLLGAGKPESVYRERGCNVFSAFRPE